MQNRTPAKEGKNVRQYTDDPVADYEAYDRELALREAKLPRCAECNAPIIDNYLFEINDEHVCRACLVRNHRKRVEEVMEA